MSRKISITFLCTMLLAIVALLGCTRVLAQEARITKRVLETDVLLNFLDHDGKGHEARIRRNEMNPNEFTVYVDNQKVTKTGIPLEKFMFCNQDDNAKEGKVTFRGNQYSCHVLKSASDGAFLIGNHKCPFFLDPPGITIDLCH